MFSPLSFRFHMEPSEILQWKPKRKHVMKLKICECVHVKDASCHRNFWHEQIENFFFTSLSMVSGELAEYLIFTSIWFFLWKILRKNIDNNYVWKLHELKKKSNWVTNCLKTICKRSRESILDFRNFSFRPLVHFPVVDVEPQFIGFAQPSSVVFHIAMDHTSWIFRLHFSFYFVQKNIKFRI